MNNPECKIRPEIVNVNSNELVFYPFSIKTSKCSGSYNNINDPFAKLCVPDVIKNTNIKVINLMSITNEKRDIKWHKTYKYKCRLDAGVSNNKQRCNKDKCRCECKELIDRGICDKNANVNVINYAILENIQITKTVSAGKDSLINQLKNVLKILIKYKLLECLL